MRSASTRRAGSMRCRRRCRLRSKHRNIRDADSPSNAPTSRAPSQCLSALKGECYRRSPGAEPSSSARWQRGAPISTSKSRPGKSRAAIHGAVCPDACTSAMRHRMATRRCRLISSRTFGAPMRNCARAPRCRDWRALIAKRKCPTRSTGRRTKRSPSTMSAPIRV